MNKLPNYKREIRDDGCMTCSKSGQWRNERSWCHHYAQIIFLGLRGGFKRILANGKQVNINTCTKWKPKGANSESK